MARLTQLRPMIDVEDLEATVGFWRDNLGFEVVATFEGTWCSLQRDGFRVMFSLHQPHDDGSPAHDHGAVSLYFDTDDVDGLYRELQERGTATLSEPTDYPWGMRQFALTDCNGLVVQIGAPVPA